MNINSVLDGCILSICISILRTGYLSISRAIHMHSIRSKDKDKPGESTVQPPLQITSNHGSHSWGLHTTCSLDISSSQGVKSN